MEMSEVRARIKVGLFFGGRSVEHEVSIISALQAKEYIDKEKYEVIPVYIARDNRMYTGECVGDIREYGDIKKLLKKSRGVALINEGNRAALVKYPFRGFGNKIYDFIDAAFPVVHGTNVEDGGLQGFFKTLNIPFAGCDVLASAVGMDKYVMKAVLRVHGLPVLECVLVNAEKYDASPEIVLAKIEEKISYPMIVKPSALGSSIGIKKAANREQLVEAAEYAFQFSRRVLVEKAVGNLKEVNCSVLGDYETARASECEEPLTGGEILSYSDKYAGGDKGGKGMQGAKRKLPADITPEVRAKIRELAVRTFQALDCCGVARVDFLIDGESGEIWVNEINTIPGSLSFYLWEPLGVKYAELLDEILKLALKRERENGNIAYSVDTNILSGVKLGGGKLMRK
jgi:D-alanine-D-alanine ligase